MANPRLTTWNKHILRTSPAQVSEAVRVRMLGGFSVSVGTRIIEEGEWHSRKAACLVKLLALAPNHRVHWERMMDLLWPDLGPKAAANNLYQALHVARRALAPTPAASSDYLRLRSEQLELCPEVPLWVDAKEGWTFGTRPPTSNGGA